VENVGCNHKYLGIPNTRGRGTAILQGCCDE
jgi:hypothetical protein